MPDPAAGLLDRIRGLDATLAVAESYTGGLLLDAFVAVPGASDVLLGGVVAYADQAKTTLLDVPEAVLASHGAVSAQTAEAMAAGARAAFDADYAVSTTGIAGPSGGRPQKPVGLAYAAAAGPDRTVVDRAVHPGDRTAVRRAGVDQALAQLDELLAQAANR